VSNIDGVSESGVDISTLRRMLARQESVCACSPLGGDETKDERRLAFEEAFTGAALAAGLDPEAADGLQDEIRSAVADALESGIRASPYRHRIGSARLRSVFRMLR